MNGRSLGAAAAIVGVALSGCGLATGTQYQGAPLFQVQGSMVAPTGPPAHPIQLAVAWYPDQNTFSGPQAIVPQGVQYQGSFPLNYTFSFYGPPPPAALNTQVIDGGTYQVAWGVLIAYEDLNGDGQLDVIADGGAPIDQILGTSVGDVYNGDPAPLPTYIAYVDGAVPPEWTGFSPGYNLYQSPQAVPESTSVQLDLLGTSELNLFVCPAFITGNFGYDLPCQIPPTGGVRTIGGLALVDGMPSASLRVTDGINPLVDAAVTVNGVAIPYSPTDGLFEAAGGLLTVNVEAANQVQVVPDGGTPRILSVSTSGDFSLQSPSAGQRLVGGQPVAVQWTSAAAASFYEVYLFGSDSAQTLDFDQQVLAVGGPLSLSVPTPVTDAYESVEVTAYASASEVFGLGGSFVSAVLSHTSYLDLIPASEGFAAAASLTVTHYAGTVSDWSAVWAYLGIEVVSDASVTVNGLDAGWAAALATYTLDADGSLTIGGSNALTLALPGQPNLALTVALPGDFSATPPPSTVAQGTVLSLTWTPSAGSTGYDIEIYDAAGNVLVDQETTATNATVTVPEETGALELAIFSSAPETDRHLSGVVEALFDLDVTP